jgi:hypothetical protein
MLSQLPEGIETSPALDSARNALGKEKPPRNDVAVPGVDDGVDI